MIIVFKIFIQIMLILGNTMIEEYYKANQDKHSDLAILFWSGMALLASVLLWCI